MRQSTSRSNESSFEKDKKLQLDRTSYLLLSQESDILRRQRLNNERKVILIDVT